MVEIMKTLALPLLVTLLCLVVNSKSAPDFLMFPEQDFTENHSSDSDLSDVMVVPVKVLKNLIEELKFCRQHCEESVHKRNSELINNLLSLPKSLKKAGK